MIGSIVAWWALLLVLGQAVAPVLERVFPDFPDRGRPLGKPFALLALALLSWLPASLGVSLRASTVFALLTLAILWAMTARRSHGAAPRERLVEEGTFLAALLAFTALRALVPDIFGAEKYMDFAFFNACLRTDSFPPEDPWLAGAPINYYYFGYLTFANVARLTAVSPEIAYNLSLATVAAVVFTAATSIARALTGAVALGWLAGLAATVLGNLDGFLQIVERRGIPGFDYWRSSRVIPNTINEFPFFSFLHGDLHPHVTALTFLLPLIATGVSAGRDPGEAPFGSPLLRPARAGALVLLLAGLGLTNPWDLPVAVTFLGAIATLPVLRSPGARSLGGAALGVGAPLVLALVLCLPFTLRFDAPFRGVGWVHATTGLREFLTVFGLLLLPPALALARHLSAALPVVPERRELAIAAASLGTVIAYLVTSSPVLVLTAAVCGVAAYRILREPGNDDAVALTLVVTATLALGACEIVFLRDSYGQALHRMNTVFKLYFQAWIFLSLAFPFFARAALAGRDSRPTIAAAAIVGGIAASLCYPAATISVRIPAVSFSLDGNAYLDRSHPDDAAAIRWLRAEVRGRPVILEATGDPYSYFARVSSNTGLPTVLGWANHEGVWRGNDPRVPKRIRDVATLYRTTDAALAEKLLDRFRVRFVFVGELERETYPAGGLAKFESEAGPFRKVFESGGTAVFERSSPR